MPDVKFTVPLAFLREAEAACQATKGMTLKAWIIREVRAVVAQARAEAARPDTEAINASVEQVNIS